MPGSGFFEPELRSDASFDVATSHRIRRAVRGISLREAVETSPLSVPTAARSPEAMTEFVGDRLRHDFRCSLNCEEIDRLSWTPKGLQTRCMSSALREAHALTTC